MHDEHDVLCLGKKRVLRVFKEESLRRNGMENPYGMFNIVKVQISPIPIYYKHATRGSFAQKLPNKCLVENQHYMQLSMASSFPPANLSIDTEILLVSREGSGL